MRSQYVYRFSFLGVYSHKTQGAISCVKTTGQAPRTGFALIMSLGLMSLMVLLIVSLSTLVEVESQSSRQQRDQAIAKQYALAGAYQGLGFLQQFAGADARVTARADIDATNTENPYWTGVWATNESGSSAPLRWLVSQTTTSTLTPRTAIAAQNRIEICKPIEGVTGSLAQGVTVERISVNTGDNIQGSYAWWVSDEGIKASIGFSQSGAQNEKDPDTINTLSKQERRHRLSLHLPRLGLESLSTQTDVLLSDPAQASLARITLPAQLGYLDELEGFSEIAEQGVHDLTAMSYGVLAHTLHGISPSLKVDLSSQLSGTTGDFWSFNSATRLWQPAQTPADSLLPEAWNGWAAPLSAFLNVWRAESSQSFAGRVPPKTGSLSRLPLVGAIPESPAKGKPVFSILPVLSEFGIFFAPCFNSNAMRTTNTGLNQALIDQLIKDGQVSISNRADGYGGFFYNATRAALEEIGRKNAGAQVVPSAMFYRMTGFFELWNPYTAEIAFPRENASKTGTVSGFLRVEVKGLPVHRITYYRDVNYTNFNENSMRLEKNDSWSVVDSNINGESAALDLQAKYAYKANGPFVANLPLPALATMSGGSVHPWTGFFDITSSPRLCSAAWGLKEGMSVVYQKSNNYVRLNGWVHNLFASFPFATAVVFNRNEARATLVASDDSAEGLPASLLSARNTYLRVQDYDKPPEFRVDVRWVPSEKAGPESGVRIGDYQMPTPALLDYGSDMETAKKVSWQVGYDTEVDSWRATSDVTRFGYIFVRKDGVMTDDTDEKGSWWLSALPDPRTRDQNLTGKSNPFELIKEPELLYAYSSDATTELKKYTLLERAAGTTRARKGTPRDEMIDTKKSDKDNAAITEDIQNYQKEPDRYFNDMFPDAGRLPLEDLSMKVPLFEVPVSRPISLGVLQHLTIEGVRPFSIGNSWGNDVVASGALNVNAIFDVFTLTGLTRADFSEIDNVKKPLPNPALVPLWNDDAQKPSGLTGSTVASAFLSRGAFNINSTSTLAWTAMLSGVWLDGEDAAKKWRYFDLNPTTGEDSDKQKELGLRRAFYRYPDTANELYVAPSPTQAAAQKIAHHLNDTMLYRRGVRTVSTAQIREMATYIVDAIRQRGQPFRSMQEFLSTQSGGKSVLERAIEKADINSKTDWDTEGAADNKPAPYSASFLTQADLLNTLAPQLQARSDTFKIRGYGDVRNSAGNIEASALCELTVQRLPETTLENDSVLAPQSPLGRKFIVVSLRWLNE